LALPFEHKTADQDRPHKGLKKSLPARLRFIAAISLPALLVIALQRISIEQPLKEGDLAPDPVLRGLHGDTVSLKQLYMHRLAVLFFSEDCPHCRRELQNMETLRETFGGGIQFLLITSGERMKTKSLLDSLGVDINVVFDQNGRARTAFGAFRIPALFLIDEKGIIHLTSFGERPLGVRREQLESLLQATVSGTHASDGSQR
jgi:peroxiredoxin